LVFQAIGPLVDLKVVWTLLDFVYSWATMGALHQDWQPLPGITRLVLEVGFFYGIFFGVDLIGAFVAYRLDHEKYRDLWWLFWQRFVYRQLMYAVLWKSWSPRSRASGRDGASRSARARCGSQHAPPSASCAGGHRALPLTHLHLSPRTSCSGPLPSPLAWLACFSPRASRPTSFNPSPRRTRPPSRRSPRTMWRLEQGQRDGVVALYTADAVRQLQDTVVLKGANAIRTYLNTAMGTPLRPTLAIQVTSDDRAAGSGG